MPVRIFCSSRAPPTERVWRDRCRVQRFTIQTAEEWREPSVESDPMPNREAESFWANARLRSCKTMSVLAEQGSQAVQGAMTKRLDGILLSMQACLNHLEAGLPPPAAASARCTVMSIPDDVMGLLENPPDVFKDDPPPESSSQEKSGTRRPFALSLASAPTRSCASQSNMF